MYLVPLLIFLKLLISKVGRFVTISSMENQWTTKYEKGIKACALEKDINSFDHVHNHWIPESQLLLEAPSFAAKFN